MWTSSLTMRRSAEPDGGQLFARAGNGAGHECALRLCVCRSGEQRARRKRNEVAAADRAHVTSRMAGTSLQTPGRPVHALDIGRRG